MKNENLTSSVILLHSEAYYYLEQRIEEKILQAVKEAQLQALEIVNPSSDWVSKEVAMTLLGIRSKSKLQKLRAAGKIEFSKDEYGRLILYSRKSIIQYLNRNKRKTF